MSKEHCCCGCIQVRTGALIIGSMVLFFGIFGLLFASVARTDTQSIVINALSVIIGGCILYADIFHKPIGYLPYLILTAIVIVVYTGFIVVFVIKTIAAPETLSSYIKDWNSDETILKYREKDPKKALLIMLYSYAAVMAFSDWILIWFSMVIYKAYHHMKGVEEYDRGQTYQVKFNV